jgi:hypothetical protein
MDDHEHDYEGNPDKDDYEDEEWDAFDDFDGVLPRYSEDPEDYLEEETND